MTLPLTITAPAKTGSYRLVVDLVEEGSHWLDPWRRSALVKTFEVVSAMGVPEALMRLWYLAATGSLPAVMSLR